MFQRIREKLNLHFQSIIKDMRSKILSPWNLKERIKEITKYTDLNKEDEFFLTRMLYPHIDAADYAELVRTSKGENRNLDLVFKTEDSKGELYTVRPPFQPKKLQISNNHFKRKFEVTFTADHEFLFILNSRNKVIGGLYIN